MGYKRVPPYDMALFNSAIGNCLGFRYPFDYLEGCRVYGYKKKGKYVAGFILRQVVKDYGELRVLQQMPPLTYWDKINEVRFYYPRIRKNQCFEYTGYFIKDKSIGVWFTLRMIITVALSGGKYFFYSFDANNAALAQYYSNGCPMLLYRGIVSYQILNKYNKIVRKVGTEHIEMLTLSGIVLIFLWRTKKYLDRARRKLWHWAFNPKA